MEAPSHESDVIERQIRIAARPETVFSFFTDPDKMTRWKGKSATLDPRPGGIYRVDINGRNVARGEYVEVVPHSRVVFTWGWEGDSSPLPPGSSKVEVSLIPDGDGTIVRLRHLGLSPEQRQAHAEGWEHYMPRLALAAAGGDPGPDPSAPAGADQVWETGRVRGRTARRHGGRRARLVPHGGSQLRCSVPVSRGQGHPTRWGKRI